MKRWLQSFLGPFAIATVVALLIRLFLIENFRISSDSMFPNLLNGDLVFVSKYDFNLHLPFSTYEIIHFRSPRRSEVVAFTLPDHGTETYVKRVVAVEGDSIAIQKGVVVVNGTPVRYAPFEATRPVKNLVWEELGEGVKYLVEAQDNEKDYGPVNVPNGQFFALGDNRKESGDSRVWGPIPCSCLKGRVALVWLSFDPQGGVRKGRSGLRVNEL